MKLRLISAFAAIAIILPAILYSPTIVGIMVVFVAGVCIYEFLMISLPQLPKPMRWRGVFLGTCFALALTFNGDVLSAKPPLFLLTFVVLLALAVWLYYRQNLEQAPKELAFLFFAMVYIAIPLAHLYFLRRLPQGAFWLLWVMFSTFIGDSLAYFAGRAFGKHKLMPRISPGKTWEGFLGQVLGALLGSAFVWYFLFQQSLAVHPWVGVGLLCGTLGPLGDLCESMLKRGFGVKDSGTIMPGHGGLLDRIDGLLFTAPAVYYYAIFLALTF